MIVHVYARGKDGYLDFPNVRCGAVGSTFSVDPSGAQLPAYWAHTYQNAAICVDCAKNHCRFRAFSSHGLQVTERPDNIIVVSTGPTDDTFDEADFVPVGDEPDNSEPEDLDNFLEAIGS